MRRWLTTRRWAPTQRQSVPTPEHYLPLLYVLGTTARGTKIRHPFATDGIELGSISMLTCVIRAMMRFTRTVQINDLANPLIDALTREQLWRGLRLRAPGIDAIRHRALDRAKWSVATATNLRELRFGRLMVRDRVSFTPMDRVRYEVEAAGEVPAATPDHHYRGRALTRRPVCALRIRYQNGGWRPTVDPYYQQFMKQAYKEADIDAIRTIRRALATEGKLEAAAN